MLHANCHALHFTLPSDVKIQKNAVATCLPYLPCQASVIAGVNCKFIRLPVVTV